MCGRYTLIASFAQIIRRFQIEKSIEKKDYSASYNIAPGQGILAIISDGAKNRLGYLRWGLIPSWAKDEKIGFKLINARAETLTKRPSFREALRKRRCLIPADSFYEWKHALNKKQKKEPMRFQLKSGALFAMAGLWELWQNPAGQKVFSCSIITTEANRLMAPVHDRMPVILRPEDETRWLNPSNRQLADLTQMLRPYPAEFMESYPVSPDVNSVKNNDPKLIRKIDQQ